MGIKVLMEGEEETGSNLETLIAANPDLVRCDAFVINDGGNMKAGEPELTAALRGIAACDVTVRSLKGMAHSGSYGGAAPDALMALIRILDNLLDEHGDVAIPGLTRFEWEGGGIPEDDYRAAAGVLPGVGLMGTGTLASRLWAKPSVTAIGLDAPPTEGASNSLIPEAKARVSMRIAPGSDPEESVRLLMEHLHASAPWGVEVITAPVHTGDAFMGKTAGPVFAAAREAAAEAFDSEPKVTGSGGTIPLLTTLQRLAPDAEFVIWGPGDEHSQVHAANESLDLGELERMIVAGDTAPGETGGVATGETTGRLIGVATRVTEQTLPVDRQSRLTTQRRARSVRGMTCRRRRRVGPQSGRRSHQRARRRGSAPGPVRPR